MDVLRTCWTQFIKRTTSVAFHSKTFSSETTGPIRTKLGHRSPWIVLFINCVQQVRSTSMMSSSGEHSLKYIIFEGTT
jgi:hypothetical protein